MTQNYWKKNCPQHDATTSVLRFENIIFTPSDIFLVTGLPPSPNWCKTGFTVNFDTASRASKHCYKISQAELWILGELNRPRVRHYFKVLIVCSAPITGMKATLLTCTGRLLYTVILLEHLNIFCSTQGKETRWNEMYHSAGTAPSRPAEDQAAWSLPTLDRGGADTSVFLSVFCANCSSFLITKCIYLNRLKTNVLHYSWER